MSAPYQNTRSRSGRNQPSGPSSSQNTSGQRESVAEPFGGSPSGPSAPMLNQGRSRHEGKSTGQPASGHFPTLQGLSSSASAHSQPQSSTSQHPTPAGPSRAPLPSLPPSGPPQDPSDQYKWDSIPDLYQFWTVSQRGILEFEMYGTIQKILSSYKIPSSTIGFQVLLNWTDTDRRAEVVDLALLAYQVIGRSPTFKVSGRLVFLAWN